jgi:hypothetical protein
MTVTGPGTVVVVDVVVGADVVVVVREEDVDVLLLVEDELVDDVEREVVVLLAVWTMKSGSRAATQLPIMPELFTTRAAHP